jgi:hypothetical protein
MDHQKAVALKSTGILKLHDIIDWNSFRPLMEDISGYATRDWSKGGKPPFDPVFMLKVLEIKTNKKISRMRVRVEHVFARMSQMGNHVCRSIGLKRASSHNHMANMLYNLDRYACLVR